MNPSLPISNSPTAEPVTTAGWYRLQNGNWGHFHWAHDSARPQQLVQSDERAAPNTELSFPPGR